MPALPQLSGCLDSDDLTGDEAGCRGLRLVWFHMDRVEKGSDVLPSSWKLTLEMAYGNEMNTQITGKKGFNSLS